MSYEELAGAGRGMGQEEVRDSIHGLMADARFAAVVGLIESLKDQFADVMAAQAMAQYHGPLAHAAGSRHGLMVLEGQLRRAAVERDKG